MNIFYLDQDPIQAAKLLIDKHVNKMQSESAQMLANCYTHNVLARKDCPRSQNTHISITLAVFGSVSRFLIDYWTKRERLVWFPQES